MTESGDGQPQPAPDRSVLPIPEIKQEPVTPLDARDATPPARILPLRPPIGAPNIVIVLIDDMGFGAGSAFGGPCQMPNAERLAANGLKYTRFHTTALCSPTRQALLTGRNHHSVNMGGITEVATSMPGYTSIRPDSAVVIAETLKLNGYNTAAFGKMHQTPPWEVSASGPFNHWPTGEGFERFYGFVGGETNQWTPTLFDGTMPAVIPDDPDYHLSDDLTSQAIAYIQQQQSLTPDKPFFLYLAFGATHAPHHVPQEWIDKYKGMFDKGWDHQREETFARQKELGVIPEDCQLTARHPEIQAWDELSDDDRTVATRLMETYAGFAEHTDAQAGRLFDALEQMGILENTLVFYILGDNGASAEGGASGDFNEMIHQNGMHDTTEHILENLDKIGGPYAYNHYPAGWAHAMNTPYQWSKIIASHWGGTRTGMVAHWPAGISAKGELRHQWCHVIDVVPTLLEVAGLPAPAFVNGIQQQPLEGTSIAYTFADADAPDRHTTQYFEIGGSRAIYHDGWSAVTRHIMPWPVDDPPPAFEDDVWELYGPDDWSQAQNLAAENPEKLRELQELFLIEGSKYHVFPLDDRTYERLNPAVAGRPDLMGDRTSMTFYPGMTHLSENTTPNVKNRSFSVEAEITVPEGGAEGAVIVQGGRFGGWTLYFAGGVPAYCHNWVGMERYFVRGDAPVAPGQHRLRYEFAYDGGGTGKGGTGTLFVDGQQVGQGRIDNTVPNLFSFDDFMDIGQDGAAPVIEDYTTLHGQFNGEISWVTIDVGDDAVEDSASKYQAYAIRQ